ncbi:hypothetical protein V6N13_027971 [Hibiscus sabdariffa]
MVKQSQPVSAIIFFSNPSYGVSRGVRPEMPLNPFTFSMMFFLCIQRAVLFFGFVGFLVAILFNVDAYDIA